MRVDQIAISNLRCLAQTGFQPGPGVNWIRGGNGAGKTSILEAIYMLGRGRSFRRAQVQPVIRHGEQAIRLVANGFRSNGERWSIGLERGAGSAVMRMNQKAVTRMSDIAQGFPLQVIAPSTFELLERGPGNRRRMLDWAVFHVEQGYREKFFLFERALRQRNAAIRQGDRNFQVWDGELGRRSDQVNEARERLFRCLQDEFDQLAGTGFDKEAPVLAFRRGWSSDKPLSNVLEQNASSDFRRGFTQSGPHKAELLVTVTGRPAAESLSRGELKRLVVMLQLAVGQAIEALSGERSVLLLDDLPAELDATNTEYVFRLLEASGCQAFATAINVPPSSFASVADLAMFHVEHGNIGPRER